MFAMCNVFGSAQTQKTWRHVVDLLKAFVVCCGFGLHYLHINTLRCINALFRIVCVRICLMASILLSSRKVPPNIEDALTSTDVLVREGANVTLKCRATGSPEPSVKWKRDDNSKISINKNTSGEKS